MSAIVVEGITKTFANRKVLDNISFKVNEGEIHGFLGPNGAGKTTTMRIITRLLAPDSGHVEINGIHSSNKSDQIYNQIGFLLEDPPLYKDMKVLEYLNFMAKLKKVSPDKIQENIDYCIEVLDLNPVITRSIENLSKGFKQRVGIAQALIHRPKILILDEPTVGLDPKSVIEIRNLILKLKSNHTIILSSHLLHEMSLVCDQMTIIKDGKILNSGSLDKLRSSLAQKLNIKLLIKEKNTQIDDYFKTLSGLQTLNVESHSDYYIYNFTHTGEVDIREELLEKAVEFGCKPIGLEHKEYSLEEIFISITKEEND